MVLLRAGKNVAMLISGALTAQESRGNQRQEYLVGDGFYKIPMVIYNSFTFPQIRSLDILVRP